MADKKTGRPKGKLVAEERRVRVKHFLSMGFSQSNIAKVLGIARNTVAADIAFLEQEDRNKATGLDKYKEVGAAIAFYQKMEEMAERELKVNKDLSTKDRLDFMKIAMQAMKDRLALSMEVGLIPRQESVSEGAIEYDRLINSNTEELKTKKKKLLEDLGMEVAPKGSDKRQKENLYKKKEAEMKAGVPATEKDNEADYYFPTVSYKDTVISADSVLSVFTPEELKKMAGSGAFDSDENKPEETIDNQKDDDIIKE